MIPSPPNKNYTTDKEHLRLKQLIKNKSCDNIDKKCLTNINKPFNIKNH